ncbi:DUF3306 domain-containing protein [Massilia horti]|uniref:DUF3306 domain-containing protein n=1 Tax=Massilia horti TaxID=2562153 RepID=UPI001E65BF2F|nr:DUF3306 domain-containing protein [Massilia horti]
MAEEGFLRRWSRMKAQGGAPTEADEVERLDLSPLAQTTPHPPVAPNSQAPAGGQPSPTLEDVATLTADADFSDFVSQGVDKAVQRLAMKKLFSDPHFHVMDGLDVYIDDYTKSEQIPAAMLAQLAHARSVFGPVAEHEQPGHDSVEQIPEGPDRDEGATDQPPPEAQPEHESIEQDQESPEPDEGATDQPPRENLTVVPAQAGIHAEVRNTLSMGSRLRGNDDSGTLPSP